MHKLRLWMSVFCTDCTVRIYRDVLVPVVPRLVPGEGNYCDFSLTGLFRGLVNLHVPGRTNYLYGQPEESLFDPCYDISEERWNIGVTGHRTKRTWEVAQAETYSDWTRIQIHGEETTTAPVVTSQNKDLSEGQASQHTDPSVPVIEALKGGVHHITRFKLRMLSRHFLDEQRIATDPVLRVGDLAGKTYKDLEGIKGIGPTTIASLVATGLINPVT